LDITGIIKQILRINWKTRFLFACRYFSNWCY